MIPRAAAFAPRAINKINAVAVVRAPSAARIGAGDGRGRMVQARRLATGRLWAGGDGADPRRLRSAARAAGTGATLKRSHSSERDRKTAAQLATASARGR